MPESVAGGSSPHSSRNHSTWDAASNFPAEADFRGFTPKLINWGINYNRRPLSLYAKWTLVGKKKVGTIAAGNIGAAGWNYQAERLRLDLSGDYRLNARYGLYFTARNIFNNRDQNYACATGSSR